MDLASETPDYPQLTDERLIELYCAGDRGAFTALIKRYQQELFAFLFRFLGSRAAAEDVFQDTFLQIHLRADRFETDRQLKPWLFTIAANKARDYLRRNKRHANVSLDAPAPGSSGSGGSGGSGTTFVDLMQAQTVQPDESLSDQEKREMVRQVIENLPEHQRQVLVLAYFHQLAYKDMADSLDVPLGTIKSRLHAAVANFAKQWKQTFASTYEN
ncbi:MAG TPA: RNA polymerase subunit sigma-70 [Phycisphaerales bacterium]|nr:RNA polymerase subunit sigma-70 [Phycisphaerales bacterium]|tara:strand:- start:98 stop:742 length:645 start_codon:yes stop_codon:yes gene_type:complete